MPFCFVCEQQHLRLLINYDFLTQNKQIKLQQIEKLTLIIQSFNFASNIARTIENNLQLEMKTTQRERKKIATPLNQKQNAVFLQRKLNNHAMALSSIVSKNKYQLQLRLGKQQIVDGFSPKFVRSVSRCLQTNQNIVKELILFLEQQGISSVARLVQQLFDLQRECVKQLSDCFMQFYQQCKSQRGLSSIPDHGVHLGTFSRPTPIICGTSLDLKQNLNQANQISQLLENKCHKNAHGLAIKVLLSLQSSLQDMSKQAHSLANPHPILLRKEAYFDNGIQGVKQTILQLFNKVKQKRQQYLKRVSYQQILLLMVTPSVKQINFIPLVKKISYSTQTEESIFIIPSPQESESSKYCTLQDNKKHAQVMTEEPIKEDKSINTFQQQHPKLKGMKTSGYSLQSKPRIISSVKNVKQLKNIESKPKTTNKENTRFHNKQFNQRSVKNNQVIRKIAIKRSSFCSYKHSKHSSSHNVSNETKHLQQQRLTQDQPKFCSNLIINVDSDNVFQQITMPMPSKLLSNTAVRKVFQEIDSKIKPRQQLLQQLRQNMSELKINSVCQAMGIIKEALKQKEDEPKPKPKPQSKTTPSSHHFSLFRFKA